MIAGAVNAALEAVVKVRVVGSDARFMDVEAVIDTGYNGFLTLPLSLVSSLNLPQGAAREATLADASRKVFDYYTAEVEWGGQRRKVRVLCVDGDPLLGTALLTDFRLEADFVVGGVVTVKACR